MATVLRLGLFKHLKLSCQLIISCMPVQCVCVCVCVCVGGVIHFCIKRTFCSSSNPPPFCQDFQHLQCYTHTHREKGACHLHSKCIQRNKCRNIPISSFLILTRRLRSLQPARRQLIKANTQVILVCLCCLKLLNQQAESVALALGALWKKRRRKRRRTLTLCYPPTCN